MTEYTNSQERQNKLRNMVVEGRDAAAVIKYADAFVETCKQGLLSCAVKGDTTELNEAALEYKVACKFMEILKGVAALGLQKEKTLKAIQDKQQK